MSGHEASRIWHPFKQHALQREMTKIARGEGAWLETPSGDRILDAISSWWVVTHGHRYPPIVAAIKEQVYKLDQVIFAGFTHEPAERVAQDLIELAPPGLSHVFFSDSGSTLVEVALKMALGYWRNIGEPRNRILALEHGYHGDTIGSMSVGARTIFNRLETLSQTGQARKETPTYAQPSQATFLQYRTQVHVWYTHPMFTRRCIPSQSKERK